MQVLTVTALPIYLPYDKAPVPFGDVFEDVTVTAATPGVATVPGYEPANGDAVVLTYTAGGSMPAGLTYGQTYYVVNAANDTFEFAATKGGAAIATTTTGANLVLHLVSNEADGVVLPFKPGASVVAFNASGSAITIQGAMDSGQATPGNGYNPPKGPGAFTNIATIAAGAAQVIELNYDWIQLSAAGNLVLLQN